MREGTGLGELDRVEIAEALNENDKGVVAMGL